jgi:osmotically-inducible protein OsmY
MSSVKSLTALLGMVFLTTGLGCASTRMHEGTGEYVADGVITTKVKAAISNGPGLNGSEIKVHTFEGVVQLSGFVRSRDDINDAVRVAMAVSGVKAVSDEMQLR